MDVFVEIELDLVAHEMNGFGEDGIAELDRVDKRFADTERIGDSEFGLGLYDITGVEDAAHGTSFPDWPRGYFNGASSVSSASGSTHLDDEGKVLYTDPPDEVIVTAPRITHDDGWIHIDPDSFFESLGLEVDLNSAFLETLEQIRNELDREGFTAETAREQLCAEARTEETLLLIAIGAASASTPRPHDDPLGAMDAQGDLGTLGAGYHDAIERVRAFCHNDG